MRGNENLGANAQRRTPTAHRVAARRFGTGSAALREVESYRAWS